MQKNASAYITYLLFVTDDAEFSIERFNSIGDMRQESDIDWDTIMSSSKSLATR